MKKKLLLTTILLILVATLSHLYFSFRSNAPFVGDGGWRLVEEEFDAAGPNIGRNRHLLFKIHHYYARQALSAAGIAPSNRMDFFHQQIIVSAVLAV